MSAGAARVTWQHWDAYLGLGEDLLPVVCEPGCALLATSQLKSYGKVPSRFTPDGKVVGFPEWTQYHATDADLEKWSSDDRLGICLQTRRVRALDLDLTDAQLVKEVLACIGEVLPSLPVRTRADSTKCLVLFELPGEYAKQVLRTQHGVIEFLATGQQCLVTGRHPDGARYTWGGEEAPDDIPLIDELDFEILQTRLRVRFGTIDWTEGRKGRVRDRHAEQLTIHDPVAEYLITHGWVRTR